MKINGFKKSERKSGKTAALLFVAIATGLSATTLPSQAMTAYEQGSSLYKTGRYQQACDSFINAVCERPRYFPAHYQLANTYVKLNKLDEARAEYQMCLDLYPDARTKASCNLALKAISGEGTPDQEQLTGSDMTLNRTLASDAQQQLAREHYNAEKQRSHIMQDAEKKAQKIRDAAQEELETAKLNAPTWVMSRDLNMRVPVFSREQMNAILDKGEAKAQAALKEGKYRASLVDGAENSISDAATGLRTQLLDGPSSGIRINPNGTSVYVRNYESSKKHVASSTTDNSPK